MYHRFNPPDIGEVLLDETDPLQVAYSLARIPAQGLFISVSRHVM